MQTLTLSHVTKSFDGIKALADATLNVAPGERVALLGHNGAGKSTMMKIILGLISADNGEVRIDGKKPGSHAARAITAYLPENVAFHPSLTGLEQVRFYLRLRGEDPGLGNDLLDRLGLSAAANRRIGTYSKGMRQRVGIAQALIGKPRLLVLDEPTSGLDPISRREVYDILDQLAEKGAGILLSSHALTEVEARADRIAILNKGVMVADDSLANLRRLASLPTQLQITARPDAADEVAQRLDGIRMNGARIDLTCRNEEKLTRLSQITELGHMVEDLEVVPPSLQDLYAHFSKETWQ